MKPKDLKTPYNWESRCVFLEDGILHVPDYLPDYSAFCLPSWDAPALFGNANPVHIEFCSGNGEWIIHRAATRPQINWVAVEMRFERVRKIWSKKKNQHLNNLIIINGEALTASKNYIPTASVAAAYVNFPDPWPKTRHAKHRIIRSEFVQEVARILKPQGELTLVTDDEVYSEQMIEVMLAQPQFQPLFPSPYFTYEFEGYGASYFDSLWRSKGKSIRYHQFATKELP